MYKLYSILFLILLTIISASKDFEYVGVEVNITTSDNKKKTFLVKRHIPAQCKKVLITNKNLWTGNFAHNSVPDICKSTFVHTKGKLFPITLDPDLETYGELEVLAFLKEMQSNDEMLLIDTRTKPWYTYFTIPGAINVPFVHIKRPKEFEFEFEDAWCSQSPDMLHALMEIQYPAEKLKWYRGGIQTWLAAGMTTTREAK